MPSRATIIINPKAGSARGWPTCQRLQANLAGMGYEITVSPTKYRGHAKELALQAKGRADLIAAVGGDGTVAEVVNGMAYSPVPLLIVPTGTENIMASELGLRNAAEHLRQTLTRGRPMAMDLGCVNGRYFMAVLGVGFDADVIHRVHEERRGHISHLSYFWPIWRTFWEYRFPRVRVEADGEQVCDQPALVFVGNTARYALGLRILRDALLDDGLLDLCVYPCRWRGSLAVHSLNTLLKIHPQRKSVTYRRCRKIKIDSPNRPLRVEVDGDPGGHLPVDIEVCPKALNLWMVPD